MVVEDDFLVREMVQGLLADVGFAFAGGVSDGREAVEVCPILRPDVILMDIAMVEMDGIEATRRIQEACPTPVVALTAYESAELVARASKAGVGAYLVKPANAHELERAVTIALARFHDMLEVRQLGAELRECRRLLDEQKAQVKTMQELVPICPVCRRIREDAEFRAQLESAAKNHLGSQFLGGLCPACACSRAGGPLQ